jgi:hypothetical protein
MSDLPMAHGTAPSQGEEMDDSHPVHAPAFASGASTGSPGASSSDHSAVQDSSLATQAQPTDFTTGPKASGSEDTSGANSDTRGVSVSLDSGLLQEYVAAHEMLVVVGIQECLDNRVVLDYEYHKGSDKHGTLLRDPERPNKVNAFAEWLKYVEKCLSNGVKPFTEEDSAVCNREDKFRGAQIHYLCLHHALQAGVCAHLGDVTCSLLSKYYKAAISRLANRVLPESEVPTASGSRE